MNQTKTREAIEYEMGLKTLHELSLKKALSEEGIDTSKIPRKKLDEIKRLVDLRGSVNQKYQDIINKAQQESSAIINKAQEDRKEELAEITKKVEDIIISIKIEQGIIKPLPQEETEKQPDDVPQKEEVKEELGNAEEDKTAGE